MKIIDCDVHNVPVDVSEISERMPAYFRQRGVHLPGSFGIKNPMGVLRVDAQGPNGEPAGSVPSVMKEQLLDAYGIDYAILIGAKFLGVGVHPEVDYALAMMRAYNDWQNEVWLADDPRFLGSILVSQMDPIASAEEIRRLGDHKQIVQVVMTSASRTPLGDRYFWPIYEAAQEMGLPIALHPGCECTGVSEPFSSGYPASYLEWHTNLSQNFMAQLTSIVCRGVLNEYKDLKFVFVEGGFGWVPSLLWRLDKNWKALRNTVPWLRRAPSEYVFERCRFTTQPVEEPFVKDELEQVMKMMQGERTLMFSSDYPHWDNDSPIRALPRLDDDLKQAILWGNAAELYHLTD